MCTTPKFPTPQLLEAMVAAAVEAGRPCTISTVAGFDGHAARPIIRR